MVVLIIDGHGSFPAVDKHNDPVAIWMQDGELQNCCGEIGPLQFFAA